MNVGRQGFLDFLHLGFHCTGDGHGVGTGLFGDDESRTVLTVDFLVEGEVFDGIAHSGQVAHKHLFACGGEGYGDVGDFGTLDIFTLHTHLVLLLAHFDGAGGKVEVVGADGCAHLFEAEAIGIRTLCYWYLLRAFKDIPYVTRPSIDDTHDFFIGQTPFNQVLDSLIYDLDKVKDYAPIHFSAKLDNQSNSSRFTRSALYAMLADLYLWKQDWDKCIECCEFVDSIKRMEYADLFAEKGIGCNITLMAGKYPLINGADADKQCGRAYTEIFGSGNSFESLFELPFGTDADNNFVSTYYNGSTPTVGRVKAYTTVGKNGEATSVFKTQYDTRYHEDILKSGSNYGIMKYVYQKMAYKLDGGTMTATDNQNSNRPGSVRQSNGADPNWIIYRYSEVLLMQAEAKVMKAKSFGTTGLSDSLNTVKNNLLNEAFELVSAVYDRAICKDVNTLAPSLVIGDYKNVDDFETLVFDERRRELLFEGKRWFDLVRQAMRNGDSKKVFTAVSGKYEGNTKSIEIKLSNPNGLFLPINKDEVKINDKLIQNPAYQRTDEVIKKAQ